MADATNSGDARPAYEPPTVTVMNEAELLKSFQITSAAATWWAM
jgi:hypothetical protein